MTRPDPWAPLRSAAPQWTPPAIPTVVVAPHPDDEVLLFGGLIALQCARGLPVCIVAVTDGEASHPMDRSLLAARRRQEQHDALTILADGHDCPPTVSVRRLGLPDGQVAEHEDTLRRALLEVVEAETLLVAPWERDHHCDHEAAGRVAHCVASASPCVHPAAGLFWGWQHRRPDELGDQRVMALPLSAAHRGLRSAALACHGSQVTGALGAAVVTVDDVAPMAWPAEYYLIGPNAR